jgi:ribonuclease P/MRP protein subunit POP1
MADNPKKRKPGLGTAPAAKRARFPAKPQHNIKATSTSTAYPNGELNVPRFLKAHENEIRSLEKAMKAAKKGLSRRAFQDVPRELRRRTGSHNPQRVPKRLRAKARQEAKDDNTPIAKNKSGSGIGKGSKKWLRKEGIEKRKKSSAKKKTKDPHKVTVESTNKSGAAPVDGEAQVEPLASIPLRAKRKKHPELAKPPTPPSRFRRRQVHKSWLPTHVWHSKRATMTPPKEPLWRFALPLAPATKTYRLTHRAASLRGAVAWDMSYMATIGLEGAEASLVGLLKGMHFAEEDGARILQDRGIGRKWRDGTRVYEGWIHTREGPSPKKIAQVTVIWGADRNSESKKRTVFVRVHPSAFLQLWEEIKKVAKTQKPAVTVEDLRFEIGSIEIMGPAAAETLCSILVPATSAAPSADSPESIWPTLASVVDAGILPPNSLVAFSALDPRLRDPPRTAPLPLDAASQTRLTDTLCAWPVDKTQMTPQIFNRAARLAAGRSLPSQQSINRRKSAAMPGQYPEARSIDPRIPVLTYVSNQRKSWTILVPWKCVLPLWRGIMRYPVSTGGNPRFGGLKQVRQVIFERSMPSFPFDYPGTDAGWAWESQERLERKKEWTKRPKGKRIELETIDLGDSRKGEIGEPWACSWERLVPAPTENPGKNDTASSPFRQILSRDVSEVLAGRLLSKDYDSVAYIFTVKISMVQRGVPTDCARVYRLPTTNAGLRGQWLALLSGLRSSPASKQNRERPTMSSSNSNAKHIPKHLQKRALAARLLEPSRQSHSHPVPGDEDYPNVPGEEDLIGFVTTGNYNLAEGKPTAVANLVLHRVMPPESAGEGKLKADREVCIVRDAGQTLGRLAIWELV